MWGLVWKDIVNQWASEWQEELNWRWAPSTVAKDKPDDAELPEQWLSTLKVLRRDSNPFYPVIDEQGAGTCSKQETNPSLWLNVCGSWQLSYCLKIVKEKTLNIVPVQLFLSPWLEGAEETLEDTDKWFKLWTL